MTGRFGNVTAEFGHVTDRFGNVTDRFGNVTDLQDCLYPGNMSALRDWGHARDYVQMQWLMPQQDVAKDFVIATGVQYSVRQFVERSAAELGITLEFNGQGDAEVETYQTATTTWCAPYWCWKTRSSSRR